MICELKECGRDIYLEQFSSFFFPYTSMILLYKIHLNNYRNGAPLAAKS